jgi:hypothetical protein
MKPRMLKLATLCSLSLLVALVALPKRASPTTPLLTGTTNRDHWDFSAFQVQWNLNPSAGTNISGSRAPADVIAASFATWMAAPNTAISISRGADSSLTSHAFDGVNLICFVCQADFTTPSGSTDNNTLAITFTTTADAPGEDNKHGGTSTVAGQMLDADMLFNPSVAFSTDGTGANDLQTVATHETGHFLGLDHSAVVRAVMFPFSPEVERTLGYDDVAGISATYPGANVVPVGSISGMVSMPDGSPVFGAHVVANSTTANDPFAGTGIRKTPVGTLTLPDGSYTITGLPADSYVVFAEPLDGPVSNDDVSGYGKAFGKGSVQTNFTTRWH